MPRKLREHRTADEAMRGAIMPRPRTTPASAAAQHAAQNGRAALFQTVKRADRRYRRAGVMHRKINYLLRNDKAILMPIIHAERAARR